nr:nitrate- and nitrite sensing domain-containing protein [Candidatus Dependentiae bacterium]
MVKYISDLKIKYKLLLMLIIPLLAVLFFSVALIIEKYNLSKDMKSVETLAGLSTKLSEVIHELQKERGRSSGFIGSKGAKFSSELNEQRILSDKKLSDLNEFTKSFDPQKFGGTFAENFNSAFSKLKEIQSYRTRISSFSIEINEALGYYSSTIYE